MSHYLLVVLLLLHLVHGVLLHLLHAPLVVSPRRQALPLPQESSHQRRAELPLVLSDNVIGDG